MSSIITFTYCSKWNHPIWIALLEEDDPKRILFYKPMGWLGQIRSHRRDEAWSASLWQTFFSTAMGTQIPVISENPLVTCGWRKFQIDSLDDHISTKACYRSVSGLTGTGSSRWSGSPVPDLVGEVVHRLDPTGSPVWTGYPGRNELPGSHCWLSFLASLTIVYCRIKELSTEQFWNSDTSTINLRVGPVNSYEHQ